MMRKILWAFLAVTLFLIVATVLGGRNYGSVQQDALSDSQIYAYRGWQSTAVPLYEGDRLEIHASGRWLYTPDEVHGPAGHDRYRSPAFYPLPGVPGGALIGRIGENGPPFYVGKRLVRRADRDGQLYLRIDDDILTDNDGSVAVRITVIPAE